MNSELCFQLGGGYTGFLLESLLNLFVVNTSWVFWLEKKVPVLEEGINFLVVRLGVSDNHPEDGRMSGRNMSVISV